MKLLSAWLERFRLYTENTGYTCDGCGAELFDYPHSRICAKCENALLKNDERVCEKCGRATIAPGICLACKYYAPRFTRGFSPFLYEGKAASLINLLKNGRRRLARFFGERMAVSLIEGLKSEELYYTGTETLLLVPVPTTEKAFHARGYNQAEQLCKSVLTSLEKAGCSAEMHAGVLQKHKETASQKHLGAVGRLQNVTGAYHVHERAVCKGRIIVLVDDIMTTGATGSECAARLLAAGAKAVYFLVACSSKERK